VSTVHPDLKARKLYVWTKGFVVIRESGKAKKVKGVIFGCL